MYRSVEDGKIQFNILQTPLRMHSRVEMNIFTKQRGKGKLGKMLIKTSKRRRTKKWSPCLLTRRKLYKYVVSA